MDDGGQAARGVTALLNVVKSLQDVKVSGNASGMKNELPKPMPRSTVTTQELSHSGLENLPSASDIRRILGPLIASNAQARMGSSALGKDTAEPQGGIQGFLTDEICDRFAEQMQPVVEDGDEFSSNGPSSMNDKKIPRAPRAMVTSGASGGALRKQNRNRFSNTKSPMLDLRIPIAIPLSTTPADSQGAPLPVPFSTPAGEGIAIPLGFTHSKEPEEGEIMGSSSPSPPHALRNTSGRKYSISPEPVRHRLPTSRTYRSGSPSKGTSYRCTSSRSPQLFRHSQSPLHTRRQSSFPDDLRGPSPPSERVRQRGRRRSSARPSESTPPISLRSATHQRRGSNYDTRLGRNEPYSRKDNAKPLTSEEKNYARSITPLDHHTSDRAKSGRSFTRFDAGPTGPKIPTRSIPLTNSKPVDVIAKSLSGGDQNNIFDAKLTASPLSMIMPLPGTAKCESPPHDKAQVVKPCREVPGLWMVKAGGSSVEIVTCEFEIDRVTADRWGIGPSSRHGEEKARNPLSLSLMCIPLSDVAVQAKLDVTSRQEVMNEITQIETVWPPPGHLVVEINPDHDQGRSWLPRHLGKEHPSIDITCHVHEGMNIIRLIQLASLADCMFVVLAKEKPPDVDAKDLEPAPDIVEMEVDGPQTTEQLLASFQTSTRIIYS